MTGYTFDLGRVINGIQLVDIRGPWQFDENDFQGRIVHGAIPQTPALVDGVIVDSPEARLAIQAEQYAADLTANAPRYVLENQYMILCDALRQALGQAPTQAKLGFEELPVMMMTLKAGSKDAYEKLRDAMDMVNAALIRYDVRWWDNAVWHPQPELQGASLKILELAQ
jgi:hypothetical protein